MVSLRCRSEALLEFTGQSATGGPAAQKRGKGGRERSQLWGAAEAFWSLLLSADEQAHLYQPGFSRESEQSEDLYSRLPYLQFHFPGFQLPVVNHSLQILNGNFRNNQFISFKSHAVLSNVVKSPTVPVLPTGGINHPFVRLQTPPTRESLSSGLGYQTVTVL